MIPPAARKAQGLNTFRTGPKRPSWRRELLRDLRSPEITGTSTAGGRPASPGSVRPQSVIGRRATSGVPLAPDRRFGVAICRADNEIEWAQIAPLFARCGLG
jgi:hypothetical protein